MVASIRALFIGLGAVAAGCGSVGSYVWADEYLAATAKDGASAYRIGVGDVISVRVFGHDGINARERVREDGKISFPFLREVQAAGLGPPALAEQIQGRLKDYINS